MIECCAKEVTASVVKELRHAGIFSIMADEVRDDHTEQLAECVRHVTEGRVKECLLAMRELRAFDAESITAALEEHLVQAGNGARQVPSSGSIVYSNECASVQVKVKRFKLSRRGAG